MTSPSGGKSVPDRFRAEDGAVDGIVGQPRRELWRGLVGLQYQRQVGHGEFAQARNLG